MKKPEVYAAIKAAKELIEPDGAWTQLAYARNSEGDSVTALSEQATCWCASGAVLHVVGHLEDEGVERLFHQCIYELSLFPKRQEVCKETPEK